jgi:hypothetical protein
MDFFSFDDVCRIQRIAFLAAHNFLGNKKHPFAIAQKGVAKKSRWEQFY